MARIIETAARILVADGYEATSTNRIAAEAGISPGSLYQYFPNKDAIVLAAVEEMTAQMADRFVAAVARPPSTSPAEAAESIIGALLEAMEDNRELVRVVREQMPRLGGSVQLLAFERRIADLTTGYLTGLTTRVDQQQVATTVWILVQAVEQLTTRYVVDQPDIPREQFVKDLARMVVGHASRALAGRATDTRPGSAD